jgi:hypothetical protein
MLEMPIYKVEAEGDTLYIEAYDLAGAKSKFYRTVGDIPEWMLTWTENISPSEIPDGEEPL